jgi:hypothetical protein
MKVILGVIVLVACVGGALYLTKSSVESSPDPATQGRETRAMIEQCRTWTEVLERAGEPRRWRDAFSNFDFNYKEDFTPETRDQIAKRIAESGFDEGFSFLYRFTRDTTFAVNFGRDGNKLNIQGLEMP